MSVPTLNCHFVNPSAPAGHLPCQGRLKYAPTKASPVRGGGAKRRRGSPVNTGGVLLLFSWVQNTSNKPKAQGTMVSALRFWQFFTMPLYHHILEKSIASLWRFCGTLAAPAGSRSAELPPPLFYLFPENFFRLDSFRQISRDSHGMMESERAKHPIIHPSTSSGCA